ncbi:hypothetical protein Q0Z83_071960 [Actinoplanes sichuanensis]|uniref:Clumping factor A n=1 Tax=Actinoplanes sichuanensis TaxID=512349 RepID=A0ABW4AA77_9ACTN|nr:hypothetical protein [Actinoplanes sichuanensis]BEL09005.1 hypothetical protein Q0Z83_071960 [Actinoplanes sichuanensis]
MIVASLLLIPVAVLFIALGVVNGSSSHFITAIVVSLLAAVVLVIGTRQSSARRVAEATGRPARREQPPAFAEDSAPEPEPAAGESVEYEEPAPVVVERDRDLDVDLDVDAARAAGARDAATHLGDRRAPTADYVDSDSTVDSRHSGPAAFEARSGAFDPAPAASDSGAPAFDPGAPVADSGAPAFDSGAAAFESAAAAESGRGAAGEHAWRPAEPADQADEFAEPDDDDPDDEPLPQSVRPADAVLVARIDTEVLVVDGRPRYHMADCPHLVGRLTEALPVNEAVELGFSPCGLCRPVDRLVATVAHQR